MVTLKKKQTKKFPDLFKNEKSVTKRLSVLLSPEFHKATLETLKQKAKEILFLPDTYVSDKKKIEYLNNFEKQKSVVNMQMYLTNIILTGSNMSMNSL